MHNHYCEAQVTNDICKGQLTTHFLYTRIKLLMCYVFSTYASLDCNGTAKYVYEVPSLKLCHMRAILRFSCHFPMPL